MARRCRRRAQLAQWRSDIDAVYRGAAPPALAELAAAVRGFDLQRVALQMDDTLVADWSLPDRGFIKGEALQNFVNQAVQNRQQFLDVIKMQAGRRLI